MTKVARIFEEEKLEAIEQTKKEVTREMAISFLKEHVDAAVICKATGLTLDELEKLKKDIWG